MKDGVTGLERIADQNSRPRGERRLMLPAPSAPVAVARRFVEGCCLHDGELTVRYWCGSWWTWRTTHWAEAQPHTVRSMLYAFTADAVCQNKEGETVPWSPTRHKIGDLLEALSSLVILPDDREQPCWIDDRRTGPIVATSNGLLDVASLELRATIAELKNEIRQKALQAKPGVPGVAGPPGPPGLPGKLPIVKAWASGRVFYEGEVVTHNGSSYQALRDTGNGVTHSDWACLAKAGRDGLDGRDADPEIVARIVGDRLEEPLLLYIQDRVEDKFKSLPIAKDGRDGAQGLPGPRGERGERGESIAGPPGPRGEQGERGRDGANGKDADPEVVARIVRTRMDEQIQIAVGRLPTPKDGAPGRDGAPGPRGERGESGPPGLPGPAGPPGTAGRDGKLPPVKKFEGGKVHYEGECVACDGGLYQATRDTGQGVMHPDWICLARAGRDGRDGLTPEVCGTYDANEDYKKLSIVALDGAAFISKRDDPGICPGPDWQMMSRPLDYDRLCAIDRLSRRRPSGENSLGCRRHLFNRMFLSGLKRKADLFASDEEYNFLQARRQVRQAWSPRQGRRARAARGEGRPRSSCSAIYRCQGQRKIRARACALGRHERGHAASSCVRAIS